MFFELFETILDRRANPKSDSYTTHLLDSGEDEILKKIGEEVIEVILAAKGQGNQRLIEESADLVYHLWVLLASKELSPDDVQTELSLRHAR